MPERMKTRRKPNSIRIDIISAVPELLESPLNILSSKGRENMTK